MTTQPTQPPQSTQTFPFENQNRMGLSKFFTFIKPYLSYIDNGHLYRKPFSILYALVAIFNLVFPLYFFYQAVNNRIFDAPGKFTVVFLLVWVIIAIAGWISFQLWWDRMSKVKNTSNIGDEFVATPVFAHLIQTLGEWFGTWIGIVGFAVVFLTTIFLGEEGSFFMREIGLDFIGSGFLVIIQMPIIGFLIIVMSRFIAEMFRALSSIANNTRKN